MAEASLCAAFQRSAAQNPGAVAIRAHDGSDTLTWSDYADRVRNLAEGLYAIGVRPGDRVAMMFTNCIDFSVVDTAVLHTGAIPFSIYNTFPADTISFLLTNADPQLVICQSEFVPVLRAAMEAVGKPDLEICVVDGSGGDRNLADVAAMTAPDFDFDASWMAVQPHDVATIIYTSGTTGPPKGVELTHNAILTDLESLHSFAQFSPRDTVVSYLPDAHIANRVITHYTGLVYQVQIATVDSPRAVFAALKQVQPTVFLGVPSIWYKIKAAIDGTIAAEADPATAELLQSSIEAGRVAVRAGEPATGTDPVADQMLARLRTDVGLGALRLGITGAAPIAAETHEFLLGTGLPISEMWGMSECAAATINPSDHVRIGTVGKALPGVQIKLADDGELLVRGPMLMKGYRGAPDKTAEVIDGNGWLHTGDIATIDDAGYVKIVDRKKDIIINSAGKNMSPSHIESAVKVGCPLAGYVIAVGDNRSYVTALINLDPVACSTYLAQTGASGTSSEDIATHPEILKAMEDGIAVANSKLARVEQIKRYILLNDEWEPGGPLVTPTLKHKRKAVLDHYSADIDKLYAAPR